MDRVYLLIQLRPDMKVIGLMTYNMDTELKSGKEILLSILANFIKERKTERESSNGKMEVIIKEIL